MAPGSVVLLLLVALVLPSQLSVSRYQHTVTAAMARSLGRPVHLSGVEWRLLPTPAFILSDLTVSEDPSFGVEPLLSARTVVASVNLLSLLRGRPEFSRIHVDQASLNLVRNDVGRWNLETLLDGPAQHQIAVSAAVRRRPLPYLEATESRLNLKFGHEKSPYSLVNSDLSFWQDQPGQWHIRLRGEPIRTDIALRGSNTQDAGEIRLDGTLQSASSLRQMPVHLQLAWRDTQLGQLSLLLLGDDAGWRGNLTADVDVRGTAESAAIQGRLRATGVHREEFAPATPLDFDSNCGLTYLHSTRAVHQLHCDTSIANGHLLYAAEMPAPEEHLPRQQTLTLQKVPVQAALDLIRTIRRDFAPDVTAEGTLEGQLRYAPNVATRPAHTPAASHSAAIFSRHPLHKSASGEPASIWTGSLSLNNAALRGGGFANPWSLPHLLIQPDPSGVLSARLPLPVCARSAATEPPAEPASDCIAMLDLTPVGYQMQLTGVASLPRLRSWAAALGADAALPDGLDEGTAEMHLQTAGSWIRPAAQPEANALSGSLHLHGARWSHAPLPLPVLIPDATLTLTPTSIALKGTVSSGMLHASVAYLQPIVSSIPSPQSSSVEAIPPSVDLHFDHLDAAAVERTLLPANNTSGLFAAIASRVHPESSPAWPPMRLTLQANTFNMDRLTLAHLTVTAHRNPSDPARSLRLDSLHATLFGGQLLATGTLAQSDAGPSFQLHLDARDLQPAPLSALWNASRPTRQIAANQPASSSQSGSFGFSGGKLSGTADLTTQGVTEKQWIASAAGSLRFDWTHGNLSSSTSIASTAAGAFNRWTGQATLQAGRLTLGANTLTRRGHSETLAGTLPFGGPLQLSVSASKP